MKYLFFYSIYTFLSQSDPCYHFPKVCSYDCDYPFCLNVEGCSMKVNSFDLKDADGLNVLELKFPDSINYADALKQMNDTLLKSSVPNGSYNYLFDVSFESKRTQHVGTLTLLR